MAVARLGLCRHRAWLAFGGVVSRAFNLQPTSNRSIPPTFVKDMKSAKAEVNEVQLYYDTIGNGRHVVVLLPGVLGHRLRFDEFLRSDGQA